MIHSEWQKQNEDHHPQIQSQPPETKSICSSKEIQHESQNPALVWILENALAAQTNAETLSSNKSWKFKGKLKAAVNLSLLHIHFSQGLLCVVLGYATSHSASNYIINRGREVILYLQVTPKVLYHFATKLSNNNFLTCMLFSLQPFPLQLQKRKASGLLIITQPSQENTVHLKSGIHSKKGGISPLPPLHTPSNCIFPTQRIAISSIPGCMW